MKKLGTSLCLEAHSSTYRQGDGDPAGSQPKGRGKGARLSSEMPPSCFVSLD